MSDWIPVGGAKSPEEGQHVWGRTSLGQVMLVTFKRYRVETVEVSIWTTEKGLRVKIVEWQPIPPLKV